MDKYASHITPRAIKFTPYQQAPNKYWHSNCPAATYTFNALTIYLPILERLVVTSLKQSLKKQRKPLPESLRKEVQSLVAQEAYHGSEFAKLIPSLIIKHYPNIQTRYKFTFFRGVAFCFNKLNKHFHYALSAAGEHFTAISADLFLRRPDFFEHVAPEYAAIWRWHAIEEIEHKAVAYDVYQHYHGGYFTRISAMFIMTLVFASFMLKPIWQMLYQDKQHLQFKSYWSLLKYHWGKRGLWRGLIKPYFHYFHPNFHPNHMQNDNLIEEWKIQLNQSEHNQKRLQLLQQINCEGPHQKEMC